MSLGRSILIVSFLQLVPICHSESMTWHTFGSEMMFDLTIPFQAKIAD